MTLTLLIAVVAALALLLTALVTPLVRGAAIGMGMVRHAQVDRWHTRPTPAVGGVAIFIGFAASLLVGFLLDPDSFRALRQDLASFGAGWTPWEGLLLGASAAFLLGLLDDFVQLRPATKLAGQVGAAAMLLVSGIGLQLTGHPVVDGGLSVVWFVGITNALNLLDNMDGLAAGVAAIAGAYLTVLFLLDGQAGLVILSLAFTGSVLGFLLHNYPPARIFMGDSGSLFMGLFLAGLALSPAEGLSRSLLAVVAVPALVLAIPILDTSVVTVGRVLEGRSISQGGKDHTSHRLVSLGLPEKRALWVLWGLAATGGAVGLLLRTTDRSVATFAGGVSVVALVLVGAYFLAVRFRALGHREEGEPSLFRVAYEMHRRYPVVLLVLDAAIVVLAYYAAYLVRWSPAELPAELVYFRESVVVVVAAKLLAFGVGGLYSTQWIHFTLDDAWRVARSALLATLLAGVALFLLERTGLSRGVLVIDLLLTSLILLISRISFRLMEGATARLSVEGAAAIVLASVHDVGLARRALARAPAALRMVGLVDPGWGGLRGRVGGFPVFGGENALANAVHDTGATAVVVMGGEELGAVVDRYLDRQGGLDVYRLRVEVERMVEGGLPRSAAGSAATGPPA